MYRIVYLLIICSACNFNDKRSQQPNADSLLPFLKKTVNPLLQNQETAAAKQKLDSILPLIEEKDNYVDMCSWLRCMAVVYQIEHKLDSARLFVDRALQLALQKDTTQKQILAGKIQTADIMADQYFLDSALHYGREAYFIAQQIDTPGIPQICLKLYNIYQKIGDLPLQKKYLLEGFMRSTSSKHKTVFATNIALYYDRVNQVDSALFFFKALLHDTSFSNPHFDAVRYENLGALLSKKGAAKEGLVYQLKGMQISRQLGELDAQSYFNIAATYRKLGQLNKDSDLLDTALRFVEREKNRRLQKKIWRAKAENLSLQKKFAPAYAAMDSAALYFQKEVDSSIIVEARELEARYGLLERDNQIKSLALANQVSEQIRERQRNAIMHICSAVAILGGLLVWFWKQKQNERITRDAYLRQQLLRGQMESHLLFGCVSELKHLIKEGNIEGSIEILERLTRLLRLCVENAREPFVPLNKELEALECYLQLQRTISSNQFDYRIDVDNVPDQSTILIPPMLLQPFAENAIVHGFKGQKEKGQINIRIQKDHKALHCIIEDNGQGFQGVEEHDQKRSLSTIINKERLEILSRQTRTRSQLKIIDKKAANDGTGVRVQLIIPYQEEA